MFLNRLDIADFDFWHHLQTRWRDMDSLGHINHAAYLSYMESARVDVYIKMGYSGIRKEMDDSAILASMEIHYLEQIAHPTELEIGHRICRVGDKSFDFLAGIFHANNKTLICSGLFRLVAFNYKINSTITVPKRIRDRCRPL